MTKTTIIITGFLLLSLSGWSQEKIQLYYNWDWEITDKSNAAYTREAEYDLNTILLDGRVVDRNRLGKVVMEGLYADNKRDGEFKFYYRDGSLESKGEYLNNKRIGNWEYFYPTGKLKQIVCFSNPAKKIDFAVLEYYDKEGNQLVKNGTGQWINDSVRTGVFENSSYKRLTGQFKDSLKEGKWVLIRLSDNKFMHSEKFKNGRFIGATAYDPRSNDLGTLSSEMLNKIPDPHLYKFNTTENFKLDKNFYPEALINSDVVTIFRTVTGKDYQVKNRQLMYAEGDLALLRFIGSQIRYPVLAQLNKITGTVYISVSVDSLGKTTDIRLLKGVDEYLDNESLRVIGMIKNWLPKIVEGKAVESKITIPVKFALKD